MLPSMALSFFYQYLKIIKSMVGVDLQNIFNFKKLFLTMRIKTIQKYIYF